MLRKALNNRVLSGKMRLDDGGADSGPDGGTSNDGADGGTDSGISTGGAETDSPVESGEGGEGGPAVLPAGENVSGTDDSAGADGTAGTEPAPASPARIGGAVYVDAMPNGGGWGTWRV